MAKKETIASNLYELYKTLGLSLDQVDPSSGFTIHNLKDTLKQLPYRSEPFRPNYFSFVFVKEAYGKYIIDEMNFTIGPGTIYFTNPGNYRIFEWHSITEAWLITFNESFLKEHVHNDIFKEFPFLLTETVQPRILKPTMFKEIEKIYQLIHKEHLGNSPYKNRLTGSLFVVLLLKIKEYFWQDYNPIYEGNRSSHIVKTFKKNLEDHYRNLINGKEEKVNRPQDYAILQHLHPNYLSNVIKTKTGKSISTWIADKTIAEAKSMLQNSSTSIKEIAYLLGFTEATHFSNYFKKNTNTSPVLYRKQHSQSES